MSKKLVTIALATYFPNVSFFIKQLESLDAQSYSNLEMIVCDDSADEKQFELITEVIQKTVQKIPFTLFRNDSNKGSNKTFEFLTEKSNGDFIAYCDQDDIWLPEKIETLMAIMEEQKVTLAYSDLSIIDENDKTTGRTLLNSSFRMKHVYGDDAFSYLVENNSVTGCAMLIRSDIAKSSIPFPDYSMYLHDHWLAICAASKGSLSYTDTTLVNYRIHGQNQMGVKRFYDVHTGLDYIRVKIDEPLAKVEFIKSRIVLNKNKINFLEHKIEILSYRKKRSENHGFCSIVGIKLLIKQGISLFLFETLLFLVGHRCQNLILKLKNSMVKSATKLALMIKS